MNLDVLVSNLLNPPVLFFVLGMIAVWLRSDLDVPQPLPKFFALYLLLSIGFKGGLGLRASGLTSSVALALGAAVLVALVMPFACYAVLRRRFSAPDAAAVAAAYGSVSAVTFITAASFLDSLRIPYGGYMVAAMALMESPAIVVGVLLARLHHVQASGGGSDGAGEGSGVHWPELLREAFLNGSIVVLVGSMVIGLLTGESGKAALDPFTGGIFKGILCLFLLDMGLVSARRLGGLRGMGAFPIGFALVTPLCGAAVALGLAYGLGLARGDALLLCALCASASYIAVPAAMRSAVPEANPGLYLGMALAVTFPFNVALGIPLYMAAVNALWG